jgi:hypothetical protein
MLKIFIKAICVSLSIGGFSSLYAQKIDFALKCKSDKNGQAAYILSVDNSGVFFQEPRHSQVYLSRSVTTTESYTFSADYEWTTFYNDVVEKRLLSNRRYIVSRDTLKIMYVYPDGRDPFTCTMASSDETIALHKSSIDWLKAKITEKSNVEARALQDQQRKEQEQKSRNKI